MSWGVVRTPGQRSLWSTRRDSVGLDSVALEGIGVFDDGHLAGLLE
jgi:hypothetical protein